jgi:hypothetical protein
MEYKNYKGQTTNFKNVTQDHLSNIYWFNKICNRYNDDSLRFILDDINERFNGELLPYRPQWQFKAEIEFLEKNGKFVWNEQKNKADIVHHGQIVGYYETPEYLRDEKINKIFEM